MNDLLRPSLYNAYHKVEVLGKETDKGSCVDVVGPVCESGDFLAKDIDLPQTQHDDLLVVHSSGAYGFVMSSNYNTRGRAAEVAVEDGKARLIRKRENFEDIVALEEEYLQ
jgi:diaminopimelate decarboxylase